MSDIREIQGNSLMVLNVTEEELEEYQEWLENETPWSGNMMYTLYPSNKPDCVSVIIESGFSHTWRNGIVPALQEYWDGLGHRIVNEVEFAID